MFIIDSSVEIPDIDYLRERIEDSVDEGIQMRNLSDMYNEFSTDKIRLQQNLYSMYGIDNPNSSKQILEYYNGVLNRDINGALYRSGTDLSRSAIISYVYTLFNDGVKSVDVGYMEDRFGEDGLGKWPEKTVSCVNELLDNSIINAMYRNGKWTTNKEAMADLALRDCQSALDILTYRKAKKYTECAESFMRALDSDGRVHPEINLGVTNRINYSNPALMTIPKELLWNMVAPRHKENMLVSIDIKQQEPWIMINILDIEDLRQVLGSEEDLYKSVFKKIFDREPSTIERKELKTAWNALTYGASKIGLREICRNIDGDKVYKYFNSIPEFKKYKKECDVLARRGVQTADTYFGTKLVTDELGNKLKRVLMDLPIQGTGTDLLALIVKHFDEEMEERGLDEYYDIYFTRNDEVIVEVDSDYTRIVGKERVFEILRDIFEHKVDDWEPFRVEIKEVKESRELLTDKEVMESVIED